MAIHKLQDGSFCISSYEVWRPGAFESERAARYAFRFKDEDLIKLQESISPSGNITFKQLQDLKKSLKQKI